MANTIPKKKVELHVHLDGTVRPSTVWELAQKKGMKIPGASSFVEFEKSIMVSKPTNLWGFLSNFDKFWPPCCGDMDAMERIGYEFCEDAHYAGVVYAEVRYSPALALGTELLAKAGPQALDEVISRVHQGLTRGEQDFGVQTRSILCALYMPEYNDLAQVLKLCQAHYDKGVVGIDLLTRQPEQGVVDEAPVVEPIVSVYQEAGRTGVHRTIHAGECSDSKSVHRAHYQLGSERIGHGYHVLEDLELYQKCVQDRVHFETCPYSSLMTGSVKQPGETHPIVRFARDGANFSVNSDDPTVTGHSVQADYELLTTWGVTFDQLHQANVNAAKSCFLDEQSKKRLLKDITNSSERPCSVY